MTHLCLQCGWAGPGADGVVGAGQAGQAGIHVVVGDRARLAEGAVVGGELVDDALSDLNLDLHIQGSGQGGIAVSDRARQPLLAENLLMRHCRTSTLTCMCVW